MSLLKQIQLAKADLDHLGSCTRTSKTPEQLAELDNKFFAALDQLKLSRQKQADKLADHHSRQRGLPTKAEIRNIETMLANRQT